MKMRSSWFHQTHGMSTQIVPTAPNSRCLLVDAANKHVYATSLGADLATALPIDPGAPRRRTPRQSAGLTRRRALRELLIRCYCLPESCADYVDQRCQIRCSTASSFFP